MQVSIQDRIRFIHSTSSMTVSFMSDTKEMELTPSPKVAIKVLFVTAIGFVLATVLSIAIIVVPGLVLLSSFLATFQSFLSGSGGYFTVPAEFTAFLQILINGSTLIVLAIGLGIPILLAVFLIFVDLWVFLAVRSTEYRLGADEITIKRGVLSRSTVRIPYKSIVNVSSGAGVFDRLFGLGYVEIETAGRSGLDSRPEGKIEGIGNYDEIADYILGKLGK